MRDSLGYKIDTLSMLLMRDPLGYQGFTGYMLLMSDSLGCKRYTWHATNEGFTGLSEIHWVHLEMLLRRDSQIHWVH